MLDFGHIPFPTTAIQQIFYAGTPTTGTNWQVWNKPRGISFIHIFILGGGGGGAAGTAGGTTLRAEGVAQAANKDHWSTQHMDYPMFFM